MILKTFTMNNQRKSSNPVKILVCFIGCLLIFSACRTSKFGDNVKKSIHWLTWEVQFKENTSTEEKTIALLAIEKYILDQYIKEVKPGVLIGSISFSFKEVNIGKDRSAVRITSRLELLIKGASPPPGIGPVPPRDELLPQSISPKVQHIGIGNPGNSLPGNQNPVDH